MASIRILDAISEPGSSDRANEDGFGGNGSCAFVLDGASGLSQSQVMTQAASDAAWLVAFATAWLERNVDAVATPDEVFTGLISAARDRFLAETGAAEVPRYAWPCASLAMIYSSESVTEFWGLGDCCVFIGNDRGHSEMLLALPGYGAVERAAALDHVKRTGGLDGSSGILQEPETLEHQRQERSLQNTVESGVWTLGIVPETARHVVLHSITAAKPFYAILGSDGYAALVDSYRSHTPQSIVSAGRSEGLRPQFEALRHIERTLDPSGETYPRFKQSDDATAVLIEVS